MPPLTIRPIARSDWESWLPLWRGYNTFYERTAPEDVTRTTFARFFDAYEPVHALVADAGDGRLTGLVHYLFHRNTAMLAPVTYLQDLFTSEAARGQGVGRALIEGVYGAARAAGSPRVYWLTHETNARAIALYDQVADRSGFIQYRKQIEA
jgi:GNAT superfamily N-acetyltransferase